MPPFSAPPRSRSDDEAVDAEELRERVQAFRRGLYDQAAYLARYLGFSRTELGRMTRAERRSWIAASSRLVAEENRKK